MMSGETMNQEQFFEFIRRNIEFKGCHCEEYCSYFFDGKCWLFDKYTKGVNINKSNEASRRVEECIKTFGR